MDEFDIFLQLSSQSRFFFFLFLFNLNVLVDVLYFGLVRGLFSLSNVYINTGTIFNINPHLSLNLHFVQINR